MKGKLLIFTFFITLIVSSQKTESIIYFKDGTEKIGYIKYGPHPFASNITTTDKVKYRTSKESKEITEFEYSEISKINIIEDGDIIRTSYFKNPDKNPHVVLEVTLVYEADVNLYEHIATGSISNGSNGYRSYPIFEYYAQRGKNNIVKIFPVGLLGNGSDKAMIEFFSDCSKLIGYIKNRTFEKYVKNHPDYEDEPKLRSRFLEIVKYYNSKCSTEN